MPNPEVNGARKKVISSNDLLYRVMEIFPEAHPQFLRGLCGNNELSPEALDVLTETIFAMPHYPKRIIPIEVDEAIDPHLQFDILKQVLPDAHPQYLMHFLQSITTEEQLEVFISRALETRNYPSYKESLRKSKLSAQVKQYTENFSVEKFVDLIPDPIAYFNSGDRKSVFAPRDCSNYHYMKEFLYRRYIKIHKSLIKAIFDKTNNIIMASTELDNINQLGIYGNFTNALEEITDIPLLHVFAYIQHKTEIHMYIESKKNKELEIRKEVKSAGLMEACSCCYDDEIMPNDIVSCPRNCNFCKFCLEKSVEIAFSEGKLEYICLLNCGAKFSVHTLQKALKPNLFSKIMQRKQVEEVIAAGIKDLECCPFCDFATILRTSDKVFKCLNPDCMKESCRICKETSHIPLKCNEVEKDTDVQKRTYVENKMTEALIRTCWKCNVKFIKDEGCNKMTCSCGAMMCYICNTPVTNYSHFKDLEEQITKTTRCPLYSDTNLLHKEDVLKGAAIAKAELGVTLKIDPSLNVEEYYTKLMLKDVSRKTNQRRFL